MSPQPPPTGTPATVGARLLAFTIDVVVVAALAAGAGLLASSLVLAAFVAAEAILALWIAQARWGIGPGAALMRLRVSRADAPYSPGAGRAFVRGSLVGLGALVLLVGAWVVQASAAWDRSGRRRSWADKAAQTVVVAVPRRDRNAAGESYALATPTVMGRSSAQTGRAAEAAVGRPAPAVPIAPVWGAPPLLPPANVPTAAARTPAPAGVSPAPAPAALAPASAAPRIPGGELLLVFDTGQRAQLALPTAVNLGRNPVATEPGDALIVVTDPDRLISKTHLRLEHDGETAWVTDSGSTNGSELVDDDGRGRVLAAGVRTRLDDGVRVRLGERIFTVSRLIGAGS
ncbi:RDD family protein [Microbacterium sp. P07]|uniref:RDD family protein n=1 Tax=Microbacterium sp. P07 TaxID=3366952 RepID=UPI003745578A